MEPIPKRSTKEMKRMAESTDAYTHAQSYESLLKRPTLAVKAMRMYYEKGEKIALLHAFSILQDYWRKRQEFYPEEHCYLEMTIPKWILDGIGYELTNSFKKGEIIGKGSKANTYAQTIKNQQHLQRYLAVEDAYRTAEFNNQDITSTDAAKVAYEALEKIGAVTTLRTIKNSHQKVVEELSHPETFWKYYPIPDWLGDL